MTSPMTAGDIGEGLGKRERDTLLWVAKYHFSGADASRKRATLERLEHRGLVTRDYQRGVRRVRDLTDLGRAVAQELQKRG